MPLDYSILDPDQMGAVTDVLGRVLIYAGAGAGKTRVVASRVAHLIEKGVSPSNILCFTFTNKASEEMKERIQLYTDGKCEGMWIGTFHKVCARLLQVHGKHVQIQPGFSIYDESRQLAVVKRVLKLRGVTDKLIKPSGIRQYISKYKREMHTKREFILEVTKKEGERYAGIMSQALDDYRVELKRYNALDFDDLIMATVLLLQGHDEVRKKISGQFHFVHVDEFQDTAAIEAKLVDLLSSEHRNLCVIGDCRQAIYGFKGADFKIIQDFPERYEEGANVHFLKTNYRSAKQIVAKSESLISHNVNQPKYSCEASRDIDGVVGIYDPGDDYMEGQFVSRSCKDVIDMGYKFSDIAVLCRTNSMVQAMEKSFVLNKIPCQKISGTGFYSREEIQCAVSYLRLLVNPLDTEAIVYLLTKTGQGVGGATIEKIRDSARDQRLGFLEVCDKRAVKGVTGPAWSSLEQFSATLSMLRAMMDAGSTVPEITGVIAGILIPLYQEPSEESKLDNLDHLLEITDLYDGPASARLSEFLDEVALYDAKEEKDSDAVWLMTIHQAKGLEFPVVFVPGVEEGLLPHVFSIRDGEHMIEEERRLLYVAITRAKDACYLSHARQRKGYNGRHWPVASRFLEEVRSA